MVELDDPVSVLDHVRLQSLAIVSFDGVDYHVDFFSLMFREVKRPGVCVGFESPIGRMILREIGGEVQAVISPRRTSSDVF